MKQVFLGVLLLVGITAHTQQTLKGTLTQHAGQQLTLTGFAHYNTQELSKTTLDSLGNFTLTYPKDYNGMGVLQTQDNSTLFVVLTAKAITIYGNHLKLPNSIVFTNSIENTNFATYTNTQGLYRNAMSAWTYLDDLYQKNAFFENHNTIKTAIKEEQSYLKSKDAAFIANLDTQSYLRWFLPYRTLVQDMPYIVQKEPQRIPEAIQKFRNTDFNNLKFKTSGLFKELIEGHYLLLENMGQSLDSVYAQMNVSTRYLIDDLKENEDLLNEVSAELFDNFEKRSLFEASAYLSVSLLNDNQCDLTDDLVSKLESYRKMKVGNTAPEIVLDHSKKLSDIKTHKLVGFGASWCPHCTEELPKLENYANTWNDNNIELIYISLDTDKKDFDKTYLDKPWQSYCDFKGWDSQAALDYFVAATPTYFLLDATNKILLRPKSVEHANAWMKSRGLVN